MTQTPITKRSVERRMIRRAELRQLVPLADTTIYEMEKKGKFPRRFAISPKCVVWDLSEIMAWLDARREESHQAGPAPGPDVRQRKTRPVRAVSPA